MPNALAAYGRQRTPKQLEAEVFSRATRALRASSGPESEIARRRALADARRLWDTVLNLSLDPENRLPPGLRAQIAAVARAALRECDAEEPDAEFLAELGEQLAAGLWS